jgi:hypothetical protein
MRRKLVLLTAVLAVTLVASATAAHAGAVLPYKSRPHGHSYPAWMRMVGQWALGDSSNPLLAGLEGDCGEMMRGAFFMTPPIDVGLEFECNVPTGRPIVLSHAGWFSTFGIDGETDEELQDAAEAGFTFTSNSLTLDGRALPLQAIDTGPYDVISAPGSFYDAILGVGTGPIRTVLRGNVVVLHPLTPGDHVIQGAVSFAGGGGDFSATYNVHVGKSKAA